MNLIRKGSIQQKLMRISMLTTCVALLLTSVLLIVNEVIAFRQSLMERMGVTAKIIGTNSTAALMFNDQKTAEETLSALRSGQHITCAVLYNRKGDVLAQYIRDGSAGECRLHTVGPDGYHLGIGHLDILHHIHLDSESIGTLYIQSDLKELYRLIRWYLVTVFMVILLSVAIAFALMSRLQKIITKPLSEMADVMNTISGEKNYSVRVAVQSQDEVGILGEGFNEMLSQIQNRDTELELHRTHLQDLVTQRTEELARTNIDLQKELADRKQAEEALRESEKRLREAQKMAHLGFWYWDVKTGNVEWSEEVFKIFCLDPNEFTPHIDSILALSPWPEDHQRDQELINRAIETHDQGSYEQKFLRPDQSIGHYFSTFQGNYDENGDLFSIVGTVLDITERKQADEELQRTIESLRNAVGATIQVMVAAVEARDPYTAGHQIRSADLARAIAAEMGLSQDQIDGIRMAGSIHDIGKLSIPAEILSKPTKLSEIEFSLIKEHARKGFEMLKDVESPWPLAEMVYQHHERMDGSGYPRNLKGDDILLEARIMAVADVVESMASHRPYRPALGLDAALEEIERNKGILYDTGAVDTCLRLFREKGYELPQE